MHTVNAWPGTGSTQADMPTPMVTRATANEPWPWRDWVVEAFNKNLLHDQFTTWQIAGDLLPKATLQQKLATGFSRNHMINGEGGRIAEENRVEYVMDMAETVGTVWLGLTLNCCRCHDHKYDPISNREYYQFFGFFNQTPVTGAGGDPQTAPNLAVPTSDQSETLASLAERIKQTEHEISVFNDSITDQQRPWETNELARLKQQTTWHAVRPVQATATGSKLSVLPDQSILTQGPAPTRTRTPSSRNPPGSPQPTRSQPRRSQLCESMRYDTNHSPRTASRFRTAATLC